jgi:hypothetical protein
MKDTLTHISIVMDRSGSMEDVRTDAEGAINHFLTEQKEVPGKCSLLFIDFDSDEPQRIVYDGPLAEMGKYKLIPRNSTPLLYAVGKAIDNTGQRLAAMDEDQRPAKVVFVIQTDGLENHSYYMPEHPYTWEHVAAMIKTQMDVFNWQVIFLGMGLDTFKQGERLGVRNVVSTVANNAATHDSTYSYMSATTRSFRTGAASDMSGMQGTHVNAMGQVFNQAGEEVDPETGKVKAQSTS